MIPSSLNSMDPNQPASAFPKRVTDEFIVEYVGELSMADDLEEGALPKNLRRHEFYELREVKIEDICYRGEGVHEFLVRDYTQQSGDTAPPIVLDGVWMTPWDGCHRLNAALARGEETIWAYVGIRPRPDRQMFHDFPAHHDSWMAATELHGLLSSMVQWRRKHIEGWRRPEVGVLMDLATRATPEYMDEEGSSLLGVAVEVYAAAPLSFEQGFGEVVKKLMERGASPDRAFLTQRDPKTTTPFHMVLGQFHPVPTLLDPEESLPAPLWEMFRPYVDLSFSKNQSFLRRWLDKAGARALKGPALELKSACELAQLDKRLPGGERSLPKPRF